MLIVYDEAIHEYRKLAGSNTSQSAMIQVSQSSIFSIAQNEEGLLAVASLAILRANDKNIFGPVDHKIPVVPWCRGHLATMVKRAWMEKEETDRISQLRRAHEQTE